IIMVLVSDYRRVAWIRCMLLGAVAFRTIGNMFVVANGFRITLGKKQGFRLQEVDLINTLIVRKWREVLLIKTGCTIRGGNRKYRFLSDFFLITLWLL